MRSTAAAKLACATKKCYLYRAICKAPMDFIFSKHAGEQLIRRSLDRKAVESVVLNPEQRLKDENDEDITVYQSLVKEGNELFLYRVFVNTKAQPNVIVTLYRTTKIAKYYES
jgi:hypothetical protein